MAARLWRHQSVSQLFHGPAPRSPLHRLAVRLRHSRSNTSTEYSLPGPFSGYSIHTLLGPVSGLFFLSRGMYPHGKVLSKEYTRPEHEGTRNMVSTCSPFTWNALPQRARTALCAIPILCIPVEPPTPAPHAVSLSTTLNGQRPRTFPFAFR